MKISIKLMVLVTYQDKILLIHEFLEKRNGYFWNLIKGTYGDIENETLPEAAVRECREEAGLDVVITGFFDCLQVQKDGETKIQFNFLGEAASPGINLAEASEQEGRAEQITKARWYMPDEIMKLPGDALADPHIIHLIKKLEEKNYQPLSSAMIERK